VGILRKAWLGQVLVGGMVTLYAVYFIILPETVPCHWNINGVIDGFSGKYAPMVTILLLGVGMYAFFRVLPLVSLLDKRSVPIFKSGEFAAVCNSTVLLLFLIQFAVYESMRTSKMIFLLPAVLIGLAVFVTSMVKFVLFSKRKKDENGQDK
jgi:uncharacterized membrane protein